MALRTLVWAFGKFQNNSRMPLEILNNSYTRFKILGEASGNF